MGKNVILHMLSSDILKMKTFSTLQYSFTLLSKNVDFLSPHSTRLFASSTSHNGNYKVKVNGMLRCPFCSGKKKQDYKYKESFAHASGVSKGSAIRSVKQKANHLALAKYLENELAGDAKPVPRPPVPLLSGHGWGLLLIL